MAEINYLFRVLALSQVLLLSAYLVIFERHRMGMLACLCGIAFAAYLVMPFIQPRLVDWTLLLLVLSTVLPSLLWLLAHWFFRDASDIPIWLVGVTIAYALLSVVPQKLSSILITPEDLHNFTFYLAPQVTKLLLVAHVAYLALSDRDSDLIDARLRIRKPLAAGAAALAAAVIIVEIWAGGDVPKLIEATGSVLMFVLALGANLFLFRSRLDLKLPRRSPEPVQEDDDQERQRVLAAMTGSRLYAQHGMTLAELSDHLQIPIHRLRRVINKGLGYRNFNQFLNHYRIDEATRRLKSEKVPILTIALDVGFKSLSSFNAAFKQTHGMTPGEFRTGASDS